MVDILSKSSYATQIKKYKKENIRGSIKQQIRGLFLVVPFDDSLVLSTIDETSIFNFFLVIKLFFYQLIPLTTLYMNQWKITFVFINFLTTQWTKKNSNFIKNTSSAMNTNLFRKWFNQEICGKRKLLERDKLIFYLNK